MASPPQKKSVWKQVGDYAFLGIEMPASALVGYYIGLGLDYLFHTTFLRIVFLIIGIVAGFVTMIRVVSRNSG